jgi:cell division control protein 6
MGATYVFPDYNATHLRAILEDRKGAFRPGVLSEDVIPKCAAIAAKDYGDARVAIQLLRGAGQVAEDERSKTVDARHVDLAMKVIQIDGAIQMIDDLAPTLRRVVEAIALSVQGRETRETPTCKIQTTYLKLCHDERETPVGQSRISQIITELNGMGLITTSKKQKGRNAARSVTLLADPELILTRLID